MDAVKVDHKGLAGLLDAVDVDQRKHEDRVGTVGEFGDS